MFIDEAKIRVTAGKGGDGIVSFRHEKYAEFGGPDGGDGGNGGSIEIVADSHISDLSLFNRQRKFKADDGQNGMNQKKHGKSIDNLVLKVPLGTQVFEGRDLLTDLVKEGQKAEIVKGGSGGWGNQHFASSAKQVPKWSKDGLAGEKKKLRLELKTIADIGLIGLPNAGKSTLLSVLTNAKPKIAEYEFTTLEPNLGALKEKDHTLIIADIPGLIEGASKGRGLGDKFLKHIERTITLVHIIDASSEDVVRDYKIIRKELSEFSEKLNDKEEIVVLNKTDIISDKELKERIKALKKAGIDVLAVSAATNKKIEELKNAIS